MIKILTGADRQQYPSDFRQMFKARAAIFQDRLGWEVAVRDGLEVDRYDESDDTVYLVADDGNGCLTGSLRLLPTTGDTMMRNEFADFFDEPVDFESPTAWECTRFCVHPPGNGDSRDVLQTVSAELLIGLCELGLRSGMEHIIGLYDQRMIRVYRRIGWSPDPLAEALSARGHLFLGVWEISPMALARMRFLAERRVRTPDQKRAA